MKFSEFSEDAREQIQQTNKGFIDALADTEKSALNDATKYISYANGGGAVAVLGYMGTYKGDFAEIDWAFSTLLYFIFGIILMCLMFTIRYTYARKLQRNVTNIIFRYYGDEISSEELFEQVTAKAKSEVFILIFGFGGLIAFMVGCLNAALFFR